MNSVVFVFQVELTFSDDEKVFYGSEKCIDICCQYSLQRKKKVFCGDRSETERGKNEHYRSSRRDPRRELKTELTLARVSSFTPPYHLPNNRGILNRQPNPAADVYLIPKSLGNIRKSALFSPSYTSQNCFQINPLNVFPSRTIFSFNLSLLYEKYFSHTILNNVFKKSDVNFVHYFFYIM